MLREIEDVRQFPDEGHRRWFSDRDMDLIVWYQGEASDAPIEGFQLCYDKQESEHALTWYRDKGFTHNRVDDGEVPFSSKMSPVLVADGLPPLQRILSRFEESASGVDDAVRELVREKIRERMG